MISPTRSRPELAGDSFRVLDSWCGGRFDDRRDAPLGRSRVRRLRAVDPGPATTNGDGPVVAQQARRTPHRSPGPPKSGPPTRGPRPAGKVLRFHFARMLAHVPDRDRGNRQRGGPRHAGREPAGRAAWRVFGDAYDRPVVREHVRELRTLGGRLGAVRDLDVQLAIAFGHRDHRSKRERAAVAPSARCLDRRAGERHADLAANLASSMVRARWSPATRRSSGRNGADALATPTDSRATVRTCAPAVAWEAYGAVWAFDPVVADADVATLHELRASRPNGCATRSSSFVSRWSPRRPS